MFTRGQVTLRPVEWSDRDTMYPWHCDAELEMLSGWGPRRGRTTYETKFREFLGNPPDDLVVFGIEHDGRLVGRIELSEIDREHGRAALGLIVGDSDMRGRGIGTGAVILMLDYAFTVLNLGRVFAHTYSFNEPARRLMTSVGFVEEGVLRNHEMHHGAPRDMVAFGMLADEFRERHGTVLPAPG